MKGTYEHALGILEAVSYMVLATGDAEGSPWATPVWFAADGLDRLFWISWPGSRHSELIARRPNVAITVFDSSAAANAGTAFYATALAKQCTDRELGGALQIYNRRCVDKGIGEFTADRLAGAARLRMYVAEVVEAWVLDQDASVDQRAPVTRPN